MRKWHRMICGGAVRSEARIWWSSGSTRGLKKGIGALREMKKKKQGVPGKGVRKTISWSSQSERFIRRHAVELVLLMAVIALGSTCVWQARELVSKDRVIETKDLIIMIADMRIENLKAQREEEGGKRRTCRSDGGEWSPESAPVESLPMCGLEHFDAGSRQPSGRGTV